MQKESKFAIFDYEKCDGILINELVNYLDNNAQKFFDFFEVETPKK